MLRSAQDDRSGMSSFFGPCMLSDRRIVLLIRLHPQGKPRSIRLCRDDRGLFSGRGLSGIKKAAPEGADKSFDTKGRKAKKEAALDCDTHPISHTVKGYFSVFLVSNIMATSLSSDFCCCVVSGTRNRHLQWVLFPVLKSEACFWPSFPAGASPAAASGSRSLDRSYMLNGPSSFVAII